MLLLGLTIFVVRILDVSLGTFRTILLVKGRKLSAATIGFIEVLIWFLIVREALLSSNDNIWIAVFYALGFAVGTIIGSSISELFIRVPITLQIITKDDKMADILRKEGYGVTELAVHGKDGERNMLLLELSNQYYKQLITLVKSIDNQAFIVVDEKKSIHNGHFLNK